MICMINCTTNKKTAKKTNLDFLSILGCFKNVKKIQTNCPAMARADGRPALVSAVMDTVMSE